MSLFDNQLEFEVHVDYLIQGFLDKGKSYDWIQDYISSTLSVCLEDYEYESGEGDEE